MDALLKRVGTEDLNDTRPLRLQESEPCGCEGRIFRLEERASAEVPELEHIRSEVGLVRHYKERFSCFLSKMRSHWVLSRGVMQSGSVSVFSVSKNPCELQPLYGLV